MSKIVVRSGNRIYSIVSETVQEKSDRIWNEKYQLFLKFIKLYGHQKVKYDKPNKKYNPEFNSLSGWISKQRELYKKGKLIDWRFKQLEKAGIIWNPLEFMWNNNYVRLLDYKNKHGNCNVSFYDKDYPGLNSWLYLQRNIKSKLPQLKFQKLDELGINWTLKAEHWDIMFEQFKKFLLENGHQRIPYEKTSKNYKPEYVSLCGWVGIQRQCYKNGKLPAWKFELLNNAGFLWEPFDTFWNINYYKLVEFKRTYGHCNVSRYAEGYKELAKWVGRQRFNRNKLTQERLQKLEDIGFDWGYSCEKWDTMYELLKSYYEENGIAYVPGNVSKNSSSKQFKMLSQWCKKQIWLFHQNNLPSDRIQLLKEINFDFEYNTTKRDKIWEEKYQRLVEYKKRFGHCNVPGQWKEDVTLANFVSRNRKNQNKLPRDKYNKLSELGLTWICKPDLWDNRIAMLKEFKEKHGHCDVPVSIDKSLANWTHLIRKLKKDKLTHRLTVDMIKELNELGFDWAPLVTLWERNFQLLVEFKNKNGHCNVSKTPKSHLVQWIRYLRSLNKENKLYLLDGDKIKKLDELGFDWAPLETLWERNYQMLVEYKKNHGNCIIIGSNKHLKLYKWCKNMRRDKLELPKDKFNKLDELGFNWEN